MFYVTKLRSLALLLLASSFLMPGAHGQIVNRTLIEIGEHVYTQRDLYVYTLASEALFYRDGTSVLEPDAGTWQKRLTDFTNNMLINATIDNDTQRYSALIPNNDMVDEALKISQGNIEKSKVLKRQKENLKVATSELRVQLFQLLKVQKFLQSKSFQDQKKSWRFRVDENARWFMRLKDSIPFRFFRGAKTYQKLEW